MIDAQHESYDAPAKATSEVDFGLRSFLSRVLSQTALGLLLAATVAYLIASIPGGRDQWAHTVETNGAKQVGLTWLGTALMICPIIPLLLFGSDQPTRRRSALSFWSFAAGIGASMSVLVIVYTTLSIATAFFAAAAGFGGCALFGYATKRDLTAASAFFTTGLVGLLVAMAINLLVGSPALTFVISIVGVIVFSGLIAWDLQRLKFLYAQVRDNEDEVAAAANTGALCMFLSFLNLFQFVLIALGPRR